MNILIRIGVHTNQKIMMIKKEQQSELNGVLKMCFKTPMPGVYNAFYYTKEGNNTKRKLHMTEKKLQEGFSRMKMERKQYETMEEIIHKIMEIRMNEGDEEIVEEYEKYLKEQLE